MPCYILAPCRLLTATDCPSSGPVPLNCLNTLSPEARTIDRIRLNSAQRSFSATACIQAHEHEDVHVHICTFACAKKRSTETQKCTSQPDASSTAPTRRLHSAPARCCCGPPPCPPSGPAFVRAPLPGPAAAVAEAASLALGQHHCMPAMPENVVPENMMPENVTPENVNVMPDDAMPAA
eukprot:792638-Pelagomonas_calceolata.AAC.4